MYTVIYVSIGIVMLVVANLLEKHGKRYGDTLMARCLFDRFTINGRIGK